MEDIDNLHQGKQSRIFVDEINRSQGRNDDNFTSAKLRSQSGDCINDADRNVLGSHESIKEIQQSNCLLNSNGPQENGVPRGSEKSSMGQVEKIANNNQLSLATELPLQVKPAIALQSVEEHVAENNQEVEFTAKTKTDKPSRLEVTNTKATHVLSKKKPCELSFTSLFHLKKKRLELNKKNLQFVASGNQAQLPNRLSRIKAWASNNKIGQIRFNQTQLGTTKLFQKTPRRKTQPSLSSDEILLSPPSQMLKSLPKSKAESINKTITAGTTRTQSSRTCTQPLKLSSSSQMSSLKISAQTRKVSIPSSLKSSISYRKSSSSCQKKPHPDPHNTSLISKKASSQKAFSQPSTSTASHLNTSTNARKSKPTHKRVSSKLTNVYTNTPNMTLFRKGLPRQSSSKSRNEISSSCKLYHKTFSACAKSSTYSQKTCKKFSSHFEKTRLLCPKSSSQFLKAPGSKAQRVSSTSQNTTPSLQSRKVLPPLLSKVSSSSQKTFPPSSKKTFKKKRPTSPKTSPSVLKGKFSISQKKQPPSQKTTALFKSNKACLPLKLLSPSQKTFSTTNKASSPFKETQPTPPNTSSQFSKAPLSITQTVSSSYRKVIASSQCQRVFSPQPWKVSLQKTLSPTNKVSSQFKKIHPPSPKVSPQFSKAPPSICQKVSSPSRKTTATSQFRSPLTRSPLTRSPLTRKVSLQSLQTIPFISWKTNSLSDKKLSSHKNALSQYCKASLTSDISFSPISQKAYPPSPQKLPLQYQKTHSSPKRRYLPSCQAFKSFIKTPSTSCKVSSLSSPSVKTCLLSRKSLLRPQKKCSPDYKAAGEPQMEPLEYQKPLSLLARNAFEPNRIALLNDWNAESTAMREKSASYLKSFTSHQKSFTLCSSSEKLCVTSQSIKSVYRNASFPNLKTPLRYRKFSSSSSLRKSLSSTWNIHSLSSGKIYSLLSQKELSLLYKKEFIPHQKAPSTHQHLFTMSKNVCLPFSESKSPSLNFASPFREISSLFQKESSSYVKELPQFQKTLLPSRKSLYSSTRNSSLTLRKASASDMKAFSQSQKAFLLSKKAFLQSRKASTNQKTSSLSKKVIMVMIAFLIMIFVSEYANKLYK